MGAVLYALLLAHLVCYKVYYANIGITFAMTYAMKKLIKSAGSKDYGDLVGLGGYTLVVGEFVKLIQAIKSSGSTDQTITEGILGKGFEMLKDLISNK